MRVICIQDVPMVITDEIVIKKGRVFNVTSKEYYGSFSDSKYKGHEFKEGIWYTFLETDNLIHHEERFLEIPEDDLIEEVEEEKYIKQKL